MENIYLQFDDMKYQQVVGIPIGTHWAPIIADLFLYIDTRGILCQTSRNLNDVTS